MPKVSNKSKVYSSTANCQKKIPAIFPEIFRILNDTSNTLFPSHGPMYGRQRCEPYAVTVVTRVHTVPARTKATAGHFGTTDTAVTSIIGFPNE